MTWQIIVGDAAEKLRELEAESCHAIVTDPPAGIGFMGKEWDGDKGGRDQWIDWLTGIMREALRVFKPGGHALVWALPRTSHWTATAIEDAGFEIRDVITHHFGSGFPKNLRVNADPRFCQCAASVRSDESTGPLLGQPPRKGTVVAASDGDPVREDGRRSTRRSGDSLGDCPSGSDCDDAQLRADSMPDQAFSLQQECVPEHIHSAAPVGDLVFESSDTPSLVPHTTLLANTDCSRPDSIGSDESCGTRESTGRSGSRSIHSGSVVSADHRQCTVSQFSAYDDYAPGFSICQVCGKPNTDGLGTALKPSTEFWILARKPLTGTVAQNVLEHGCGGLNIDGSRVGDQERHNPSCKTDGGPAEVLTVGGEIVGRDTVGRWPPNLLLTHSALCDDAACRPCCPVRIIGEQSGESKGVAAPRGGTSPNPMSWDEPRADGLKIAGHADTGTAARFFPTFRYEPKPSTAEREAGVEHMAKRTAGQLTGRKEGSAGLDSPRARAGRTSSGRGNTHPTVKSVALMQWLCRLITPPGGVVLDYFCGSGSTGIGALREGFSFVGIELGAESAEIARNRIVGDAPLLNAGKEKS